MKSVVISKRFAQINNCKLKQRIIRVTMMLAWRLERPDQPIRPRRRFHRKASSSCCPSVPLDRSIETDSSGLKRRALCVCVCVCGTEAGGNNCVSSLFSTPGAWALTFLLALPNTQPQCLPACVVCLPGPSILHEGPLHYFLFFLASPHNRTPLHLVKLALI